MILLYIPLTIDELKNRANELGSALRIIGFSTGALKTPKQYEVIWK